ncbi:MAG: extracellular solute-binding protein [Betaproteobacteria bacterium]|nr:extracellular solute-binding protein [Betaproteobacteria bacterium]
MASRIGKILLGLALLPGAVADDVLLAAEYREYARLEKLIESWQERTGHQIVWLPRQADQDVAKPDLYYLPVQQMLALIDSGKIAAHPKPDEVLAPAPMLAAMFSQAEPEDEILYRAVPQSVNVSLLWYRQGHLAAAGIELGEDLDWDAVENLAIKLNDPMAGVRGFCPPGVQMHGLMVRAMIAEAGGSWQQPQPEAALSEDWVFALERYARLLAAAAPADSAELDRVAAEQLFVEGKCALFLGGLQPPEATDKMAALALPGAIATAWPQLRLLAVAEGGENIDAALSFMWYAATGRNPSPDAVVAEKAVAPSATAQRALRASLLQPPAAVGGSVSVEELDSLAEDGISKAITGLLPASEALAAAVAP